MDHSAWVAEIKKTRSRVKTEAFEILVREMGDLDMAEISWIYWGEGSLKMLDSPLPAINPGWKWWHFFVKRNTVRSLLKTDRGREDVWPMLVDASAWLL